jgi:hypothetical protein
VFHSRSSFVAARGSITAIVGNSWTVTRPVAGSWQTRARFIAKHPFQSDPSYCLPSSTGPSQGGTRNGRRYRVGSCHMSLVCPISPKWV